MNKASENDDDVESSSSNSITNRGGGGLGLNNNNIAQEHEQRRISIITDDDDHVVSTTSTTSPGAKGHADGGGCYNLVEPSAFNEEENGGSGGEDQENDAVFSSHASEVSSSSSSSSFWKQCERIVHTTLLPDDCTHLRLYGNHYDGYNEIQLFESPTVVKLLKFAIFTFAGIALMHRVVRWFGWEHRETFTLQDFVTYESNLVFLDLVFFFCVGRLHKQSGVDHLAWVFWASLANFYNSYITTFGFLRQSFTLYAMHCSWSWALWLFVLLVTPLVITLILLHVVYAVRHDVFGQKLVELILSVVLLLLPLVLSPYFHLHHWYAGWFVGMHANFGKAWWSRATMAWCWGCYINGIAVYGRDPVLTCGYALFISEANRCPFLDCYLDGIQNGDNETNAPIVQPMVKPDWRNCSADTYHP